MKTIFTFMIFTLMTLTFKSNAQCINGKLSYPLYKVGATLVNNFDNDSLEIVRIEYDLVFDSKESFRNLSTDWEYTIFAFADDGVKDLNIKLFEYDDLLESWTLVSEDNKTESYAMVSVKPGVDALYKVEVIVNEYYEGFNVARYGLMYLHE
jgi:hypothetical protein